MTRQYYTSRTHPKSLTLDELYHKVQSLYLLFQDKDYFKNKAGISEEELPDAILQEAALVLTFQPFPITDWSSEILTEDHIFDTIEFLYDRASKPGKMVGMTSETGWNYYGYENYDDEKGKEEFREKANVILAEYKTGFELTQEGMVLAMGTGGLQYLFDEEIVPYDEVNVDSKVHNAITKWRNRNSSLSEKREAIRELADVFEWLKKTKNLESVLDKKDESDLFVIANKFGIRHHNPEQETKYDQTIWYFWMFHFYLATYHAAIRLLIKKEKERD